jgi:ABC-2 type transport system ATP-binding protein
MAAVDPSATGDPGNAEAERKGLDAGPGAVTETASSQSVLAAVDVRKSFGSRVALADVSFEAAAGELVACIGPNGAGKTTLLSIVAGLQEPDGGAVRRPSGAVGWVPQRPALYGKLSVVENLRLFARLEGVPNTDETVARMLAQTSLSERADEQVQRLSAGNQQRVNIAIGLLSEPAVLLLDEPSSALDPRQRERLWSFIADLAEGGTAIVYSTHNVSEAEHANRLIVLADGERLFWGPPEHLWELVDLRAADDHDFEAAFVSFLHQRGH